MQLNEFFVEGGDQQRSHVLLHITEPSTPAEEQKGCFFAVCETNGADNKYIMKLQSVIDEIECGYYETPDGENKNALEIVLEKINPPESGAFAGKQSDLHCLVGVVRPPHIVFASYNQPQAVLFYKNKEAVYQKIDLIASNQNEKEENQTGRHYLFSHIIEGKISPNDFLYIGTPNIGSYFSHDRLQKIITSRPPRQSAEHLEKVLSELKNGLSFGGLIMYFNHPVSHSAAPAAAADRAAAAHPPTQPTPAVNSLFLTEQQTAHTLAPSLVKRLGGKIKTWQVFWDSQQHAASAPPGQPPAAPKTAITSNHLRTYHPTHPARRGRRTAALPRLAGIAVMRLFIYAGRTIFWLAAAALFALKSAGRLLYSLLLVITNLRNHRRDVLDRWSKTWYAYKQNYKQLPLITKILIFLSLVAVILLIGGILYIESRQQQTAEDARFQQIIKDATNKKETADSALIYDNIEAAFEAIASAQSLLNDPLCQTQKKNADCARLSQELAGMLARARKITVAQTALLLDAAALNPSAPLERILKIGGKIIGFSANQPQLVIYDTLTREVKVMSTGYNATGFVDGAVPKENDYAIIFSNQGEAIKFNPADYTFKKIDVAFPATNPTVAGAVIYNRRLYVLDANNNQIYKHDSAKAGFGLGKPWLKDTLNLQNGAGLTIEGDIFVLNKNGEIYKLNGGQRQEFALRRIDPPLKNGAAIWSYTDLQYLYVLDREEKRLLILDKNGQLKTQVLAETFLRPTSMIVDEPNKTAYIADSNKLYQIALPL